MPGSGSHDEGRSAVDLPAWVSALAPEAAAPLAGAAALATEVVDPVLTELARIRISQLLGDATAGAHPDPAALAAGLDEATIAELRQWPTSVRFGERERACLGLAEQFVIDVGGVTDDDVARVLAALGPAGLYGFVQALYVFDMTRRLQMSLGALADPPQEAP